MLHKRRYNLLSGLVQASEDSRADGNLAPPGGKPCFKG